MSLSYTVLEILTLIYHCRHSIECICLTGWKLCIYFVLSMRHITFLVSANGTPFYFLPFPFLAPYPFPSPVLPSLCFSTFPFFPLFFSAPFPYFFSAISLPILPIFVHPLLCTPYCLLPIFFPGRGEVSMVYCWSCSGSVMFKVSSVCFYLYTLQ